MAVIDRPFPPGEYPVVVVGSGAGGLQLSYELRRLGVGHAVLSADEHPGGMFQRFPLFDRLNTCSRPHAVVERGTRAYYRYDWNSLLAADPAHQVLVPEFMAGEEYFPSRPEMAAAVAEFARRTSLNVRYGCRWEGTRAVEDGGFVLVTSDGEYRCKVAVLAIGMTEPWRAPIPGLSDAPHYADLAGRRPEHFSGKRVFLVGKSNSGFEVATALLPRARQLILGSPHPVRPSVVTAVPTPPRAQNLEPYEDHRFGGGTFVVEATIERVERTGEGWRVHARGSTRPWATVFEVDEVIAATGFRTPMLDLPALGVATFSQDRLPAQTPFWESTTVAGIYFAGSVSQGHAGLRKNGFPSRSGSVCGFRFNALVQAAHIARTYFGASNNRPRLAPDQVIPHLLEETTSAPELWSQQAYLARVVSFSGDDGIRDEGVVPLVSFVDGVGPDAAAVTVETHPDGSIQPVFYVRRGARVEEHALGAEVTHDFTGKDYQTEVAGLLHGLVG